MTPYNFRPYRESIPILIYDAISLIYDITNYIIDGPRRFIDKCSPNWYFLILYLDCKNEKATAQEHKTAIDDLKNNFNDILKRNKEEMEENMAKIKSDKEKEKMETDSIKQELKERDKEIARLKEEINVKNNSNKLILSKCNLI